MVHRSRVAVAVLALAMVACRQEVETAAPDPRPVRTVTVEKREAGVPVTLTGRIDVVVRATDEQRVSLAMIPIAPTVFWGPMAFAIMGGLLVGTILTLVFLPTLYVTWFGWSESRAKLLEPPSCGMARQCPPR
jgi:hypothetical protein